jgi:hypothetical protein
VVCEIASSWTVWVVVNGPAAVALRAFGGGTLDPTADLDNDGTTVGMVMVLLEWIDSRAVVDAGTLVVKRPLPRVTTAGWV